MPAQIRCQDCDHLTPKGVMLCCVHFLEIHQEENGNLHLHSNRHSLTLEEQYPVHLNEEAEELESTQVIQTHRRGPKSRTQSPAITSNALMHEVDEEDEESDDEEEDKENDDGNHGNHGNHRAATRSKMGRKNAAAAALHKKKETAKRIRCSAPRQSILKISLDPRVLNDDAGVDNDEMKQLLQSLSGVQTNSFSLETLREIGHRISRSLVKTGLLKEYNFHLWEQMEKGEQTEKGIATADYSNQLLNERSNGDVPLKSVPMWIEHAPQQICNLLGNLCYFSRLCTKKDGQFLNFGGPSQICKLACLLYKLIVKNAEDVLDMRRMNIHKTGQQGFQVAERNVFRKGVVTSILAVLYDTVKSDISALPDTEKDTHTITAGGAILQYMHRQGNSLLPSAKALIEFTIPSETSECFYEGFQFLTEGLVHQSDEQSMLDYCNSSLRPILVSTNPQYDIGTLGHARIAEMIEHEQQAENEIIRSG